MKKKIVILIAGLILLSAAAFGQKSSYKYKDPDIKRTGAICALITGISFTGASILEGSSSYGTYVTTTPGTATSSPKVTYVTPPFYKQTPRNIMFVVGVSFSIGGLIALAQK